jgi:hypothetical protein
MLSPMAKGIQSLHSTVELSVKYPRHTMIEYIHNNGIFSDSKISKEINKSIMFYDWAINHKTCISLNGGVSPDLDELKKFLNDENNIYAWAEFYEDESLGKLMTSISLILPEKIYLMKNFIQQYKSLQFTEEGTVLYKEIPEFNEIKIEDLEKIQSFGTFSSFEIELIKRLSKYKLAN